MKTIPAVKARKHFGQLLDEAFHQDEEFIIERAGKPMAVLISIQKFERWQKQIERD